jgi:hypothetical protein
MKAIDSKLEERGLLPFQRDMHVPKLFWEAFGWAGNLLPDAAIANAPGFHGDILFAKAREWYRQIYGDRMNSEMSSGGVPVRLGNAIWRLQFPIVFGTVNFTISRQLAAKSGQALSATANCNMLDFVDGLTPALVERLNEDQLKQFSQFFIRSFKTLTWRDGLPKSPLLEMARKDYDASTSDLLGRRYGQARWGAQQAVEKLFKAVLKHSGVVFPTSGPAGHNLARLAQLLNTHHGVTFTPALIDGAKCSPGIRYNEEPSTSLQALGANHAALEILDALRVSRGVTMALANPPA